MRKILAALLALVMLCTVSVAMVSCGVSMEKMEETCKELKADGKIDSYTVLSGDTLTAMLATTDAEGATKAIMVIKGDEMLLAIEFEDKDSAKAFYESSKDDEDEETVIKGKIVIGYDDEDLYKLVV